jgi:23S rRNA pseudouridine2605 synthase
VGEAVNSGEGSSVRLHGTAGLRADGEFEQAGNSDRADNAVISSVAAESGSFDALSARGSNGSGERIVPMRLQKFLARAGAASRRGSENLMTAGRVTVNGEVVTELGSKVDPLVDVVAVDGIEIHLADGSTTLVLNKPAGVITTMHDQLERPCVADLVPTDRYPGLFPIGRLDTDTTGVLLFSTDGELGNGLLHPRHHVKKTYIACVEGTPSEKELDRLRHGIELDDGSTRPAEVEVLFGDKAKRASKLLVMPSEVVQGGSRVYAEILKERSRKRSYVSIGIREGRYHQVKRMFAAIGHPVVALHRDTFGTVKLGDLPRGKWRVLDESEVTALRAVIDSLADSDL